MNKIKIFFVIYFSLFFLNMILFQAQDEDAANKWLREVEPIITKAEKAVFESLKTDEARARFISYFWKVRDPNPETPYNEYKQEYYRRLNYVKSHFGGTRSDRGRLPRGGRTRRKGERMRSLEARGRWIRERDGSSSRSAAAAELGTRAPDSCLGRLGLPGGARGI